jgi:hypothetical protein
VRGGLNGLSDVRGGLNGLSDVRGGLNGLSDVRGGLNGRTGVFGSGTDVLDDNTGDVLDDNTGDVLLLVDNSRYDVSDGDAARIGVLGREMDVCDALTGDTGVFGSSTLYVSLLVFNCDGNCDGSDRRGLTGRRRTGYSRDDPFRLDIVYSDYSVIITL